MYGYVSACPLTLQHGVPPCSPIFDSNSPAVIFGHGTCHGSKSAGDAIRGNPPAAQLVDFPMFPSGKLT